MAIVLIIVKPSLKVILPVVHDSVIACEYIDNVCPEPSEALTIGPNRKCKTVLY